MSNFQNVTITFNELHHLYVSQLLDVVFVWIPVRWLTFAAVLHAFFYFSNLFIDFAPVLWTVDMNISRQQE